MLTKLRILLVEDDKIDQLAFERLVDHEDLPYEYSIANNTAEALNCLSATSFDLVLLDYSLGDGTGLEILDRFHNIPTIFITGSGSEEIAVEAMKAGAVDYLVKDADRRYLRLLPLHIETALKNAATQQLARQLENERLQMQMIQEFIQNVSHDLRTPLTGLVLSAGLAQQQLSLLLEANTPESAEVYTKKIDYHCKNIELHAQRLHAIIDTMIYMTHLNMLDTLTLIPQNLNELILNVLRLYAADAGAKNIQLVTNLSTHPVWVAAAGDEMGDLVGQLLNNAIKFSPSGSTITISTAHELSEAVLSVADMGIGIDPAEQLHIFDPLYRTEKSRNTSTGGIGMGLALVKRIADLHGARIEVQSAIGHGATFRVIFPELNDSSTAD